MSTFSLELYSALATRFRKCAQWTLAPNTPLGVVAATITLSRYLWSSSAFPKIRCILGS